MSAARERAKRASSRFRQMQEEEEEENAKKMGDQPLKIRHGGRSGRVAACSEPAVHTPSPRGGGVEEGGGAPQLVECA